MPSTTRYEIIDDSHGEGGFGKIQKRRDKILERFVAVKSLKLLDDAEARERFVKEAKTLARMSHPNVPAIFDVEFLDKEMHIYFEFVEGESLRKFATSDHIPSIDSVRRWFSQIGSALAHSHELGIVHRDVKPENIIISTDHTTATLVDFGIALNSQWHSSSYRAVSEFEDLYVFWKPGETLIDRHRLTDSEWSEWGSRGVWHIRSVQKNDDHPAKFPLMLAKRIVRLFSESNSVVLDPFLGSGTTAIAAIQTGRQFIGIEKEKRYLDIAAKNIEDANSVLIKSDISPEKLCQRAKVQSSLKFQN